MRIGFACWWRAQGIAYIASQLAELCERDGHTVQICPIERAERGVHPFEEKWLAPANYDSWLGLYKPELVFFIYHAPAIRS